MSWQAPVVFHSACGWLAGKPVEKHRKWLMALRCVHAAKVLLRRASRCEPRKNSDVT